MKSGVPWQITGVRRWARDTAREAARRSGVSVGEWLDNAILDSALHDGVDPRRLAQPQYDPHDDVDLGRNYAANRDEGFQPRRGEYPDYHQRRGWTPDDDRVPPADDRGYPASHDDRYPRDDRSHSVSSRDRSDAADRRATQSVAPSSPEPAEDRQPAAADQGLAEVKNCLDGLTLQLSRLVELNASKAQVAPADPWDAKAPRQLVEAISRIDSRLNQLTEERHSVTTEMAPDVNAVDRAAIDPTPEGPGPAFAADPPTPLDQALMEIADRQRTLDGYPPVASSTAVTASGSLPRAHTQELSGLEQQLRQINTQIETLRQPCGLDKAVETLRSDLAEIGLMVQEAMPRTAIEALESEVRKLAERLDDTHQSGTDSAALSGVERGLAEVRDALSALTPAENLAGVEQVVQQLSQKIDVISSNAPDPATLKQLEGAIGTMRSIVSHVASNDALAKLLEEVHALADKVGDGTGPANSILSALEGRIGVLADALEARNRNGQNGSHQIEAVVNGLADKIERMQLAPGDQAALGHLEDRIAKLVEKLDASDSRLDHLETIERGLAELLIHLEPQRGSGLTPAAATPLPEMDALLRDVADLRQTEKKTLDSLEVVHGTLGHVVDRLAMIETDMRAKPARSAEPMLASGEFSPSLAATSPVAPTPVTAPTEETPAPDSAAVAHAIEAATSELPPTLSESAAPLAPGLPIEPPQPNELAGSPQPIESAPPKPATAAPERRPIDPNLPPDHPLEPGSGVARGRPSSPADRIAASQAVLGGTQPPAVPDPNGKSNFIAAARRAAQAASRDAPTKSHIPAPGKFTSVIGKLRAGGLRTLIMTAIAILIVLGSLQIARNMFGPSDESEIKPPSQASAAPNTPAPAAPAAADDAPADGASPPAPPAAPSPNGPASGRQGTLAAPPSDIPADSAREATTGTVPQPRSAAPATNREVTGSLPHPARPVVGQPQVPPAQTPSTPPASPTAVDKLPAAFGGALRAAAAKGDPAAHYEIAMRYAEGRGVPQNPADAVEWLERAAKRGFAPAQFRLGGFYEKGFGVTKNLETARRFYAAAGEAGNAKALHNLAVLYAEGIDGKPDYQTAAKWFRRAADYGVADSQYNLAVLYIRGIGVEQNSAEAYKWFALAARDGDAESAKKRDEIGARLDPQTLAAAKLVTQAWTPEPQPTAAVQVKAPAGGWEGAAATPSASAPSKRKPPAAGPTLDLITPPTAQ